MRLKGTTSKMDPGSFLMSNLSSLSQTALASAQRRIRSLSLEEVLAQASVLLSSKLMSSLSSGNLFLSCQKVEISGTKFAILKDKLMQWVVLTPRLKSSSTMKRNGMKSHAIL